MGRVAALDIGTVRIGFAVSDPLRYIATPYPFILAGKTNQETLSHILKELHKFSDIDVLVLGFPLLLSGQEGKGAKEVRLLADLLKSSCSFPIVLWDERLTTAQVEKSLKECSVSRKKRTQIIDSLTAALILENYLSSL